MVIAYCICAEFCELSVSLCNFGAESRKPYGNLASVL